MMGEIVVRAVSAVSLLLLLARSPSPHAEPVNEIVSETTRVGQNVVLPCGKAPESRQALANKTVVIWQAVAPDSSADPITIPIVSPEKTAAGHTFKNPDGGEKLVVNYVNASLRILNVTLGDRKNFYCRIYHGSRCFYVVHVRLIVVDKPGPPVNITVESLSDSELRVRWAPGPDNFSPILFYKLRVSKAGSGTTHEVNLTANETEYMVPHLEPYTLYFSSMQAINKEGGSQWTLPTTKKTAEGVPQVKLVIYESNSTSTGVSVTVVVADVSEQKMLGILRGFDAQLLLGDEVLQSLSKNGSSLKQTFTFKKLKPFTIYKVRSRVRNGRHAGNWAHRSIKTEEGKPGRPRLFATDIVTERAFTVRWEAPAITNGIIKSYVVTVVNNKTEQEQILRTNNVADLRLEISRLEPYTKYLVYVAADTKAGTGPRDGPRDVLTDVGPPPQPELLDVQLNVSGAGVTLRWRPKSPVLKPEQTSYMLCWSETPEKTYECIHTQRTKPRQSAFMHVVPPRGPVKDIATYSAMIPVNKLKARNQWSTTWFFYVYGRTKSLYCPNDKAGTTPPLRITRRHRRLLATVENDQPCFYAGSNSNTIQQKFPPDDWDSIPPIDYNRNAGASDSSIMILFCILGLIIFISCFIGFFVVCRRCGTHRGYDLALNSGLERVSSNGRGNISGDILEPLEPALMPSIIPYTECGIPPIEATLFRDHVANLHANSEAGFSQEFDEIDKNQMNSWPDSVARMPENAQKNRYTNIFPYDHTRVRLLNLQGRKSDYINANFIDGYDKKNAYIAAQGPMPATFEDFWQMIWEQRTNTIVMISNLIERGRLKCDQYWPTTPGPDGAQQYGRIHITLNSQEELAYYVVREMTVRNVKSKKFRHVFQYQYTDWPDFAVPESPLPVLVFIRKTVRHIGKGTGPILVHCSAGVGRTGTYLCIESQIRQFERERNFNVRGFLEHIRQQRMKLVQTEEQYAFIHDALLMHYLCPYHEIPRNELSAYVKVLKETEPCSCLRLEREYMLCVSYRPHDWELIYSMKAVNERKSRSDIYPTFNRQVALPAEPGVEGSNYINASYLQGYWRRDEFIVTQHPFEHTITDFWKMVWDQNSSQVILLTGNAPSLECPCFWPSNPDDTKEAGYLRVGFLSRREHSHSTHLKFLVSSTREDYSLVSNMWICKSWPNSTEGCMDLFQFIRFEREKTGPFIVIDELGGSRAGIFCALNTLMDQLDKEHAVDVYFVFKMYHRQRPGIWQSQADLEFVYDAIERYSREPPPVHSPHSGSTSHHSSPGVVLPEGGGGGVGGTGDRHLSVVCSDSLPRGGRLTPNGCTMLAGADPTLSFYSNGGGTLPRLVVTTPINGSATLDSNASHDPSENNELPT